MPSMRSFVACLVLYPWCDALQELGRRKPGVTTDGKNLTLIMLDETEVENRGSHCLDGSVPGFYLGKGNSEDKWLFWLQGGGYCTNESTCLDYLPIPEWGADLDAMPLMNYATFSQFSHVHIKNCDLGVYMGDRQEPVVYNGHKLYFQGARILKHVVDTVSRNYTMTQVLLAGGSGGGHSIYGVADYFGGLLPATVQKYGVAPINGWFISDQAALSQMMNMMVMVNTISKGCSAVHADYERYKCIDPSVAYKFIKSPIFMTQIYDYTFAWGVTSVEFTAAYDACINYESESHSGCTDYHVNLLNEVLSNYTDGLAEYLPYNKKGNGGYVSTCTKHIFYDEEDTFGLYENRGTGVGDALAQWWKMEANAEPFWFLPCTLGRDGGDAQCERSCNQ